MKILFLSLAIVALATLTACKKEDPIVLILGRTYGIRGDIFNKGAFQPLTPVTLIDLYTGPNGIPYAHVSAAVNWPAFALQSGNGVSDQTVQANQIIINDGIKPGDPVILMWSIPQYDLK